MIKGVFDYYRFAVDVKAYARRHKMTPTLLARQAGLCSRTVKDAMRHAVQPSLPTACALAHACDLNLDSYRMEVLI